MEPNQYAGEFSNGLTQSYLRSLLLPVEEQGQEGLASSEEQPLAGTIGMATTGSRMGMSMADNLAREEGLRSNLYSGIAGRQENERLTDESQGFQDYQRQQNEDFERQMDSMGYSFRSGMWGATSGYEKQQSRQGMITGAAMQLGSSALMAALL